MHVHTHQLFLFADPQAHGGLEQAPDDQGGDKDPAEDDGGTQQLGTEGGAFVGEGHHHQAEQAAHPVYRDGTDRIIDLHAIEGDDGVDHQGTGEGADQAGEQRAGGGRVGGNGDQAAEGAVEDHGEIRLAPGELADQQGADHTGGRGGVGVDEDGADGGGVSGAGERELGAAVEAEPAHPQDQGAQGRQRQVGAGDGVDLALLAIFATTGAEQQHGGEGSGGARHVHDAGAREVGEARLFQEAAAPGPEAFHGVDEAGHHHAEQQEGPELHALGHRPGDDGGGGRHEDHLEEEVGVQGVARVVRLAAHQAAKARQPAAGGVVHVHDVVTDQQEHDAGDGIEQDVLGQDLGGVLGADQAGLQHGEPGGHPHDQHAGDQQVEGVECIAQLANGFDQLFHVVFLSSSRIKGRLRRSRRCGCARRPAGRRRRSCRHLSCRCRRPC